MKLIGSLILFLVYCNCRAQSFDNINSFTTQNGLSNNSVTALAKDEDGFLWVGTLEGLNFYDGTEFINVLRNEKNNLPSNIINKICCVDRNTLLVATQSGVCILDTKTLRGNSLRKPDSTGKAGVLLLAWDIYYDKNQKEIWAGAADGLYVFSVDGKLKRKITAENSGQVFVNFILVDKLGRIFVYSPRLQRFSYPDFQHNQLIPFENLSPEFRLNDIGKKYTVRSITAQNNMIIISFTGKAHGSKENVLVLYDDIKGTVRIDSFPTPGKDNFLVNDAYRLNDSVLLVNAFFGEPWLYNLDNRTVRHAADHPLWFSSWPDGIPAKILVEKNYTWVASNKGLLQLQQSQKIFTTNVKLNEYIRSKPGFVSYSNGIWYEKKFWLSCLGTGIYTFDTVVNQVHEIFDNTVKNAWPGRMLSEELTVSGNDLWFFSLYGPAAIDPVSLKPVEIKGAGKDPAFNDHGLSPVKDSRGNIWTSIPTGVSSYDPSTRVFTNYTNKSSGGILPIMKAMYKTEDGDGNMWLARQDTLVKFNVKTHEFYIALLKKNGDPLKPIQDLASDGHDVLYINVQGSFIIYYISTGKADVFTKQTGIVSTYTNGIATDKNGNAWIATAGGLVFYDRQLQKFHSYTKADGLPDENIVSLNFTDESKTELFLGFSRTFCLFSIDDLLQRKNESIHNVITGVEMNGQAISMEEGQDFSYKDNSLSFFYTGINFTGGQQNSYAYMLTGLEKEWVYCGKKRLCSYINLPPGDYTFKIKSANQQGEWNESPASFSFTIKAPFWQTWWFRTLVVILSVMIIYWFIKRRDTLKEKENKVALQMSELKLTALQSQMNPHFIFNSLNSIQNYILKQNREEAVRYLTKFSRLMRRILDHSFSNLAPLSDIIETLKMYMELEAFRFNNEFSWEVNLSEDDDINNVKLPPLLLQPYVENAIIHGLMQKEGNKTLTIDIFKKNNELHCIIEDNGVGRAADSGNVKGHISRGQKLTADMLATMKQLLHTDAKILITDKKDEQGLAEGTIVEFIIPLSS